MLRDSYHLGVPYGQFDHIRLVDSLRILRVPAADEGPFSSASRTFQLGVESGVLRTVESLLLARYHMHSQVYFHPVVKAYELLLIDFMKEMYSEVDLSSLDVFLEHTDSSVYSRLFSSGLKTDGNKYDNADRILKRRHFRQLYTRNRKDDKRNLDAFALVEKAAHNEFGVGVKSLNILPKDQVFRFLVEDDDYVVSYVNDVSNIDEEIPKPSFQCVYVDPARLNEAKEWLKAKKQEILDSSLDEEPINKEETKSE
ncbi:MAG: hypothetical protein H6506_02925 [Calditrichaeota bacterium]|nr:hypothetical protein [Calditrichota bacterium]MCB9391588.1 hypothetical protein [Calditrichota bacterium]